MLGNDVSELAKVVEPLQEVLAAARASDMMIVHTREGHRPDLSDAPPSKLARGNLETGIGDPGPKGRVLVRGELGHDIVPELAPVEGEVVLDKPGKGAFYATDLELLLRNRGVTHLIVTGVTTEVCVHTTVREGNDRGYRCVVPGDCCGSYFPKFHEVGLEMIAAQGGIFGWVTDSKRAVAALVEAT
jgi:nicotinamidase-related amidase